MYRFLAVIVYLFLPVDVAGQGVNVPLAETRLRAGDQVRITVWRKAELSGDFAISSDGTVAHPLYREVQVTGIPLPQVEERLRTFLARYETNPQFVVLPLIRIIVSGEVRQPNILSVPPGTTVTQVVVLGGGPSDRGRLDEVQLVRENRSILVDLTRSDSDQGQIEVRSGDQIIVGRRGASFREWVSPLASTIAAAAAIVSIFSR
ncbi:MAG: polysaccharide biosynthesis/export family protein [Gemmatimonadota bacterium]|nr:polysaccharide biosynthesis/export family protein [Gemmatimonadota bacterium]